MDREGGATVSNAYADHFSATEVVAAYQHHRNDGRCRLSTLNETNLSMASAQDLQALLRFLSKDAKLPLAQAISKVKDLQAAKLDT